MHARGKSNTQLCLGLFVSALPVLLIPNTTDICANSYPVPCLLILHLNLVFTFVCRFIVAVLTYFIAGMAVNYNRGARGCEMVPNAIIWKDLPLLIKVRFITVVFFLNPLIS